LDHAPPRLVRALAFKPGTIRSDCRPETRQIVVAVWSGGVKPKPGGEKDSHLAGYRVVTNQGPVRPFALGDLDDRDNSVHLCLATDAPALRVTFAPDLLVDSRGDANPETSVEVSRAR